jgi:hypothetical protein
MTKLIGRRACLFLLASMLMGAMLGAFNSTNTFAQDLEIFDDGYGGGAGWSCPITEIDVGDSICRSTGCTTSRTGSYTCVFFNPKGSSKCPPLEMCTNP